ncbi:MAG: energy transducer TonB [Erythrobacter sp.]
MEKYGTMVAFSNVSLTKEAREFVSPPETDGSSRLAAVVPTPPPPIEDQRALNVETGKTITAFALGQGDQKIVLQTGDLGQAFKVLNQCTADLVRSWGFDFDQALTRKPNLINPAKVARRVVDNYPTAALRNEEQGEVRLRLIIEANGKVSDCIAVMNNPSEVLQKGACKQMRRAKFKPALDEKAQPVRHYYLTELTYQLY